MESGNRGQQALIASVRLRPGDRVLVDRWSWGATLGMLAETEGVLIDTMPVNVFGQVDVEAVRHAGGQPPRLIVLTWCPATGGLINPAEAVGSYAAEVGALYLIDACQAVGQIPANVRALRCHGLVASGRKWLRGPRGTAIVFASSSFQAEVAPFLPDQFGAPLVEGRARVRSDARRYETAEAHFAGRLGLGAAIDGALALGVDRIGQHVAAAARQLREALSAVRGVEMEDRGPNLSGIVAFRIPGVSADEAAFALSHEGVAVSALTSAYAPLDMGLRDAKDVIRAAPHLLTTSHDLDLAVPAIGAVVANMQ